LLALLVALPLALAAPHDPRADYDVTTYRLDLSVDPEEKRLSGTVAIELFTRVVEQSEIVLDLQTPFRVESVVALDAPLELESSLSGRKLKFTHAENRLTCQLDGSGFEKGTRIGLAVTYSGKPTATNNFDGFHWSRTADGKPWIATSCQSLGSSSWWPCKDSYFHPEDKPDLVLANIDVPKGLYAVSNGRLVERESLGDDREVFRWRHEYPCETYAITLNVAPYVVTESELALPGLPKPIVFATYVLPENVEKAKLQFQDVPRMLEIFGDAFGPFPFPRSKYALVETPFWGMEHSTAVAYGSSYPAWCKKNGLEDPYAGANQFLDYILIHESAHEWWGNAVSANAWGHFWIHEGFGTYAEGVYLEKLEGRARADEFFERAVSTVDPESRLYRGDDVDSEQAYAGVIYGKGACVLNTLRHYVDDDAAWWKSLREFNLQFRYRTATTEDFAKVLERETGKDWKRFFDEWVYGTGYPKLSGTVRAEGGYLEIDVENEGSAKTEFRVPLDLSWKANGRGDHRRVWLDPGRNNIRVPSALLPTDVEVVNLGRVLGRHDVRVVK
jgi:aminopeptidase N